MPGKRSALFGGLASPLLESNTQDVPAHLKVESRAMVHVQRCKEGKTPMIGNVAEHMGASIFKEAQDACTDTGVGVIHGVWGCRFRIRRASAILVGM